jgi:hypothetical protein
VEQNCGAGKECGFALDPAMNKITRECVDAGTLDAGENCAGSDNNPCAPGLACTNAIWPGGGGTVVCLRLCRGDAGCPAGEICDVAATVPIFSEVAELCTPAEPQCDLLTQICPETFFGCFPSRTGQTTLCADPGHAPLGWICENSFETECQKGHACIALDGGPSTCKQLCNLDAGSPGCDAGTCHASPQLLGGAGVCN